MIPITLRERILQVAQQLLQEGMQQETEKLHMAKNMLYSNEPKEKIHQFTGLSWHEIEQLLQEEEGAKN